jgi:hypothetical protein
VVVDDGPGHAADDSQADRAPYLLPALNMLDAMPACSSEIPATRVMVSGTKISPAVIAKTHLHGDVILIALTFGNQSDWARNVHAAGGCTIRISGRTYRATSPRFLSREEAAPLSRRTRRPWSTQPIGVRRPDE